MTALDEGLNRYLSRENLDKIRNATVGIAGAGGLGSNCAVSLVRSGFRTFVIADYDTVEPSNLNRQFYFSHQIGMMKVDALKENLLAINPALQIIFHPVRVTKENAEDLFSRCDAVVEAFDRVESKLMITEAIVPLKIFFAAASGIAGYGLSDEIKIRKINERFFCVGDFIHEIDPNNPPLAPRVAIAAAKQADLVLEYILKGKVGI
jgi:sulfur carrier protein ThiS adenylyltransferase